MFAKQQVLNVSGDAWIRPDHEAGDPVLELPGAGLGLGAGVPLRHQRS